MPSSRESPLGSISVSFSLTEEAPVRVEDGGRLCWESASLPVAFEHSTPETVTFVQSGFNVRLLLSHPAEIVR